jgi:copper chaperone NosL
MSAIASRFLSSIIGPRVPEAELVGHAGRYAAPNLALLLARIALLASLFMPYWRMTLKAPQYPHGLHVQAYLDRLIGDVAEIDSLNHYIGMRPLGEAAQFERTMAVAATVALILLIEGAMLIHNRWAALLALPTILFPVLFLADLYYWMNRFGHELNPHAPLSTSIKPFTPPILGTGKVGQFSTIASAGPGLILAAVASLLVIVGLYLHRRAYKPLVDARK